MIYSKLVIISESFEEYGKAIDYLNKIQNLSNDKDVKVESFRKWLDIMKRLNLYDEIILEIQEKLILPEFDSNILQDELNIELAISYMKKNNFSDSKDIFNNVIETTNQKNTKAQSYYWLGYISLYHEFEIDLAIEYFNLVYETHRSSKYNKQSREHVDDIESYKNLLQEYSFLLSDDEDEMIEDDEDEYFIPRNNIKNNLEWEDSLLFIIAEKLFFDFNQTDLSIKRHKELINEYPSSKYSIRSKKIINQLIGDSNYNSEGLDSLALSRDDAWDSFDNYIANGNLNSRSRAISIFSYLAKNYNDFYSYYSLANIYENHLYDPYLSIKYFLESYRLCNDDKLKNNIKNKMMLIESDLNKEVILLNKKINYLKAINFITTNINLDSAMIYLKLNYQDHSLKNELEIESKKLDDFINNNKDSINKFKIYISNDSLILQNINLIDSVNYIFFKYYKEKDSIFYIDEVQKNNYLLSLFKDSILHNNSIDTLEIKDNNYNNKMPNINNDIAPNFNKK